jgi:two-component system alkaline phosphatase synthesis response regulator PhoP
MDVLVAMLDSKVKFLLNNDRSEIHRFGNMEHHPNIHTLFRDGKKIELTILENTESCYFTFLRNPNKVINRDELMLVVWGYNSDVNTQYIGYAYSKIAQERSKSTQITLSLLQTVTWNRLSV